MGLDIVRGNVTKIQPTNELVDKLKEIFVSDEESTVYLGYPLTANADSKNTVDALLVSQTKGVIAFRIPNNFDKFSIESLEEEQDDLYYLLDYNFKKYPSLKKKKGRGLAFEPKVITWLPSGEIPKDTNEEYLFADDKNLSYILEEIDDFDTEIYPIVCEVLQKVSNIKPRKKRENVTNNNSKGGIIKQIEKEIANLDRWQKKSALEVPEGPQRIRGLAGSGKTIVLALKAAYLHSQKPDWKIAVTFYTRSLAQQYEDLIRKFTFEYTGEEPNWDNLLIVHAWGTIQEPGIYSIASSSCGIEPMNFTSAKLKFGRKDAFAGVCKNLLDRLSSRKNPIFDAILVDEAQDLPSAFFRICHNIIKPPKRLIWAYDELQNLNEAVMPSLKEMFGEDENGNLNISLQSGENEALRDIPLPICYRNPPWTLTLAHSIGFGIYRENTLVQMFEELDVWSNIGYKVEAGKLDYGNNVTLVRSVDSSPKYFKELLKIEDSLIYKGFETNEQQYAWVANEIEKNITVDELDPDDILVIFPDAYYSKTEYMNFRKYLMDKRISSILAGVNTDRDIFRIKDNISCSGIYRAKGNEAPMVYIMNSEYSAEGPELIKLRNILFTAITRSRAWVRICGVGEKMNILLNEIEKCVKDNSFNLSFTVPTLPAMEKLRKINKERTEEETKKINKAHMDVKNIISTIESGVDPETIPGLESLMNLLKQSLGTDNNEEN